MLYGSRATAISNESCKGNILSFLSKFHVIMGFSENQAKEAYLIYRWVHELFVWCHYGFFLLSKGSLGKEFEAFVFLCLSG